MLKAINGQNVYLLDGGCWTAKCAAGKRITGTTCSG